MCEAKVWVKNGTEAQLRSAMTFMTGDQSHMLGKAYDYDVALDFITSQSAETEARCSSLFK